MNENAAITLHDVAVRLGGHSIFSHLTLEVPTGSFVVVLGPNGAGKSTLLKLLLGLLPSSEGNVRVLGKTPQRGNHDIGYAPQHRVLETDVAIRARDVVSFGYDGDRWGVGFPNQKKEKTIDTMLREVDATHLAQKPMSQLSGGEQQRLLIAQALMTNPRILLLDEPLSNLDLHHTQEIVTLLKKITHERQITTLLVAHDINPLLSVADTVLYMANGRAALGHPEEIITSEALSTLYETNVEVVHAHNRVFVIGAET